VSGKDRAYMRRGLSSRNPEDVRKAPAKRLNLAAIAAEPVISGPEKPPRLGRARKPMRQSADLRMSAAIRPAAAERARVVLAVALIPLAPYGEASAADMSRVRRVLGEAPLLADIAPFALDELIPLTLRALAARGPDRVLADLRGLTPPGLAEAALALAVRAAFQGGRVPERAMGILGGLANRLGVPIGDFADMLEAITAEQRCPG